MYDQIREDTLYIMLYASVTMLSLMASCYLLFRQGNAFLRPSVSRIFETKPLNRY